MVKNVKQSKIGREFVENENERQRVTREGECTQILESNEPCALLIPVRVFALTQRPRQLTFCHPFSLSFPLCHSLVHKHI